MRDVNEVILKNTKRADPGSRIGPLGVCFIKKRRLNIN